MGLLKSPKDQREPGETLNKMDLPKAKLRQEYIDKIKVFEANLQDTANGTASQEHYKYLQDKLDKLAERFQYNENIGSARYKLYELQALLYYFQNRDNEALAFIEQAIEVKGASYKRAEQLIKRLQLVSTALPGCNERNFSNSSNRDLPLQLQSYIKGLRTSSIIMAIISAASFFFIPWAIFYVILATKLKPEKVPNRKLIKAAAIVTLPLCIAIIPIFVDIEFWKMNKRLRRYHERGSSAFISNKEFLRGEPKRKKRSITAWSVLLVIIAILIILIIVALASDNSSSGSTDTARGDAQSSEVEGVHQRMESLRSQYNACSTDLEMRRESVDIYSDDEVSSFNNDLADCESLRLKLNSAIDEYNKLTGFE